MKTTFVHLLFLQVVTRDVNGSQSLILSALVALNDGREILEDRMISDNNME